MSSDGADTQPKLRFPEFAGYPLLDIRLGAVTEECSARNRGKLPAQSIMGVSKEDGIVAMQAGLAADDIARYKILCRDWFAYNPMRLNIGSIARWRGDDDVLVSPDYVVFRCREQEEKLSLRADYLDHFRRTTQWRAFTNEAGDGGVRVRIYYDDLAKVRLVLPLGEEQQKIADCLTSLDALIAAGGERLAALKEHKKGLLQALFPAEGQTIPRLRFPEFRNAREWRDKTIGGSSESFSGGTPSTSQASFYGGGIPFIRSAEIDASDTELTLTSAGLAKSAAKMVAEGDVLIALYGANSGNAAISKIEGAINQAILALRHESNNEFLLQFWTSRQESITRRYLQGGQGNLSADIVKSILIPTPDEDEQREIATCLTTIDHVIVAQKAKVAGLGALKAGLMQQLFPSPAEAA